MTCFGIDFFIFTLGVVLTLGAIGVIAFHKWGKAEDKIKALQSNTGVSSK